SRKPSVSEENSRAANGFRFVLARGAMTTSLIASRDQATICKRHREPSIGSNVSSPTEHQRFVCRRYLFRCYFTIPIRDARVQTHKNLCEACHCVAVADIRKMNDRY